MRRWYAAAALGLALAVSAAADDQPKSADPPQKKDEPKTPAEQLKAIKKEAEDAQTALYKTARDLDGDKKEDEQKVAKLYEEFSKKQEARFAQALEIAKADPKSDTGFAALEWLLTTPRVYYVAVGKTAMQLATEYHAANPKIGKVIATLGFLLPNEKHNPKEDASAMSLIRAVAEKNPDRTARGQAAMALAWQAKTRFEIAQFESRPDEEKLAAEAEKQFEAVVKDYGDCKRLMRDEKTLGEEAQSELFELRNLRVGKVAPDIEGEDLDGVKFKLSDYRGKVVVIDFWGDW